MTIKKFFIILVFQWLLFAALKFVFFKVLSPNNIIIQLLYILATAIVTVALVRRLGIMNYLEAMFVAVVWFVLDVVLDLAITANYAGGISLFYKWHLWVGYLIMMVFVFFMHKKRHVEIRKEQVHHHGHH